MPVWCVYYCVFLCYFCYSLKPKAVILHDLYLCISVQQFPNSYEWIWQWSLMVAGDLKHSPTFLCLLHTLLLGGGGGEGPLPLPGNYLWQTNRQLQLIISPPLPLQCSPLILTSAGSNRSISCSKLYSLSAPNFLDCFVDIISVLAIPPLVISMFDHSVIFFQ